MTTLANPEAEVLERASLGSRVSAWLSIGAAVLALVLAPPSQGDLLPAGILGTVTEGQLEQLVDGTWRVATAGDLVPEGARVRTPDHAATIRTRDGAVSLAVGTEGRLDAGTVDLQQGSILVETPEPVEVSSTTVAARGRGAWRVDLGSSPRVGVYEGGATVTDLNDREASIGSLQQIDIVEGDLGRGVALRYLDTDDWDARLLARAIAVDRQVERLTASFEADYGVALQPAGFYADFVAVEGVLAESLRGLSRFRQGDRFGPPAETLVAVVVTDLLNERAGLSPADAVGEIRSLRQDGATWGLVLAAHDLGPDELRAAADQALRARQQEEAAGTAVPVASGTSETTTPDEDTSPDGGDGGSEPEDPEPSPSPRPSPSEDDVVEETIDETTDDVADLLEPVPGGSEAVEDVSEAVEELPLP